MENFHAALCIHRSALRSVVRRIEEFSLSAAQMGMERTANELAFAAGDITASYAALDRAFSAMLTTEHDQNMGIVLKAIERASA